MKVVPELHDALTRYDMPATPAEMLAGVSYSVRNYTIVGNYKIIFPQWRTCQHPEAGLCLLEVSVSTSSGVCQEVSTAVGRGGDVLSGATGLDRR